MISVSIEIDRSSETVWAYFTTPNKWSKWNGGDLKDVTPGWQKGGKLIWSSGGVSPIASFVPGKAVCISGSWMDDTYVFEAKGSKRTLVKVVQSDPKGGARFNDGGAANKAQLVKELRQLKECIENETSIATSKKWWALWK
jgi:uncharacterized protein YndB with AHSA1/START domain